MDPSVSHASSSSHAPSPEIAGKLSRKIVLATVGSLGDLHPFIALGQALRARGLLVVLACAAEYQSKVEAAGLAFHPLRPGVAEVQRDLGMDRAEITRRVVARPDFLFRRLLLPYVRAAYEDMLQATADADLVMPSSLAFGARLAAEKRAIPWIAVVLQPMMFLSAYDPPVIPGARWLTSVSRALGPRPTRPALWAFKKAVGMLLHPLHAVRADLGLAPALRSPLFDGQFAQAGALGLYSTLLGGVQPDYPRPTSIVGFAPFDSEDGFAARLDPALEAFLQAGEAPLVFTLGSLIVNSPARFFRESIAAARIAKRRAVLLAGPAAGELAGLACADVFVCGYAPHSLLFARGAAIIHHGGIGTLAQAVRAGRPQLIAPHFADQFDNAARAERLGVARVCAARNYSKTAAGRDLARLLGDERCRARAREAADFVSAEDGAAAAARIVLDTLEQVGRKWVPSG